MRSKIGLGLIGCGVITQRTLPGLLALCEDFEAEIRGLCDPNDTNVNAVARAVLDVPRYDSVTDICSASAIDAVLIATPIALHSSHVRSSIELGRHVYCHKTLAPTSEECLALDQEARRRDLTLACSPGQLLLPAYSRAQEIVESGELGQIVSIDAAAEACAHRFEAERADESPAEDAPFSWEWYHSIERGGGPLDDMFVYPLAFLTALFGPVSGAAIRGRLVDRIIQWRGRDVVATAPDAYSGYISFGEITATVRSSFSSNTTRVPWGFIVIRGNKGALEIEKHNDLEYRLFITSNTGSKQEVHCDVFEPDLVERLGRAECHVLTDIREFLSAMGEQRQVVSATAQSAARVAAGITMIKSSAENHGQLVEEL